MYIFNHFEEMCSNVTLFGTVLSLSPADSASLQSSLCGLDLNITKMFEELAASADGLSELFQAVRN